jgi:hypothetical protein
MLAMSSENRNREPESVNLILEYYLNVTILFLLIFFGGSAIFQKIGQHSETRAIHGRYVFGWMIGSYVFVALLGPFVLGVDTIHGAIGIPMFAMLAGWLMGTIHGGIVLFVRRE